MGYRFMVFTAVLFGTNDGCFALTDN